MVVLGVSYAALMGAYGAQAAQQNLQAQAAAAARNPYAAATSGYSQAGMPGIGGQMLASGVHPGMAGSYGATAGVAGTPYHTSNSSSRWDISLQFEFRAIIPGIIFVLFTLSSYFELISILDIWKPGILTNLCEFRGV